MQSISKTLKVSEFLSISVQLAKESAKIIRDVKNSGNLEQVMKGKDDPLTVADLKAQTVIFRGLTHFFPGINLVGEEDEDFKGHIDIDYTKLNRNLLPFEIFTNSDSSQLKQDEELNIEDVCVFIDPLDATLSFTKNQLENITTLIGLAYKNRPYLGVVGQPYSKKAGGNCEYLPQVYFSHSSIRKVFYLHDSEIHPDLTGIIPWELKRNNTNDISKDKKLRIVVTDSRFTEDMQKDLDALGTDEIIRLGGSGNKFLAVAKGLADGFLYNRPGTKRWDTCACEALISSLGGVVANIEGNFYEYGLKPEKKDYLNDKGVLAMVSSQWHAELTEKLKKIYCK